VVDAPASTQEEPGGTESLAPEEDPVRNPSERRLPMD
jgi:hypothetical protein